MASCNQKAAESVPAIDPTNFDESIALNEDFYQYATGGWQKKNPLTPEYSRYGVFEVLAKNNEERINDLFSAMLDSKAEVGSVEQKIADLYTMGLDSVRLNSEGVAPVKSDGSIVGRTHFQRQKSQTVSFGKTLEHFQQLSRNAPAAILGPHGDVRDIALVKHNEKAGIADDLFRLVKSHQKGGAGIVQFLRQHFP